jgi:3,4-dihydroxy 2-butanone 4-phosphate synthase/GTP cyclohydrolase II
MDSPSVTRLTSTRIPTVDGEFTLALYQNSHDDKDHLALLYGDVEEASEPLVRIHSECFTGDVLGSLRCDCGEQLNASMRYVAEEGQGIILYLRQEGRGIGLLDKLRAYDLQDEGYDTVEANLMLGHGADERDYTIAALMLRDLDVGSIRLLTNNPEKIESLEEHDVSVSERVPLEPHLNRHNSDYLQTKVERMRHQLDLGRLEAGRRTNHHGADVQALRERATDHFDETGRPFVTLTYAQSLDGSIAAAPGQGIAISGSESMSMTHELRAAHDAILVGIGTVLADDPRLNVRHVNGSHPRPVVLDSRLRFPPDARLLSCEGPDPIVVTAADAPDDKVGRLRTAGATVVRLPQDAPAPVGSGDGASASEAAPASNGAGDGSASEAGLSLDALLDVLADQGIRSLMVEGGAGVITSFLRRRQVDHLIVTVAPMLVGGMPAVQSLLSPDGNGKPSANSAAGTSGNGAADPSDADSNGSPVTAPFPRLKNVQYQWLGDDLILQGDPHWGTD